MFFTNFILGLLIVVAGVVTIKFNTQITQMFGRFSFIERKLGAGTTYYFFQFLSILVILFGFLMAISLHDNVGEIFLGPVIDLFSA